MYPENHRSHNVSRARRILEEKYGALQTPANIYIIFATARSGSNLLGYGLRNMGFGIPLETFNFSEKHAANWNVDQNNFYAYMQKAYEHQTSLETHTFGIKLFWYHLQYFLQEARELARETGFDLSAHELLEVFFPDAKYIFIQRKDKVRQAISYARSFQSGVWIMRAGSKKKHRHRPIKYHNDEIKYYFDILLAYDILWENFIEQNQIHNLRLAYEDLSQNYEAVMQEVLAYLNLSQAYIPPPVILKQADNISDIWHKRFHSENSWLNKQEFKSNLEMARYAPLLADRLLMIAQKPNLPFGIRLRNNYSRLIQNIRGILSNYFRRFFKR
jgi:LPS sulfotransferase NodH